MEHIKGLLVIVAIIVALGIVGEMDYQDACRADPHCKIDK